VALHQEKSYSQIPGNSFGQNYLSALREMPIHKNTSSTWCAAPPPLGPVYGQGAFYS